MPSKTKNSFTTHPETDREKKNLLFLNLIKNRKAASRTELSKLTEVNVVTVSNYINSYIKKGLALEGGYDISSGGRRPELVELNKDWGVLAGIDIAEERIRGVFTNLHMDTVASECIVDCKKKALRVLIEETLNKLFAVSKSDERNLKKIGISVSQASDNSMTEVMKAKDDVEEKLGIPVLVGKAALCAAFGEKNSNLSAKEARNVLYAHEDIGEAIFIKDDELYEADEEKEGYAYLRPWNRKMSVINQVSRMVERGVSTKIIEFAEGQIKNIALNTIIKAAENGDDMASDLVKIAGVNLGVRIAYLINLFEPECVIIGGGIEKAVNLFMEPLKTSVNKLILQRMHEKTKLVAGVLGEDASVKGAAFLAIREAFIEA